MEKSKSISYEEFNKNASDSLMEKFNNDCSKYSEDGCSDNYFYANSNYWEGKLKEDSKETIEEATEAYADIHMEKFDIVSSDRLPYFHNDRHKIEDSFEAGAEWQKKQSEKTMYSEQEVDELIYNIIGEYGKHYGIMIDGGKLNELREQFKKK